MDSLFPFLLDHWLLAIAFVVVLSLLLSTFYSKHVSGVFLLTPEALVNAMNHDKAKLIDIRTKEQFSAGHIASAINIPEPDLTEKPKKLEKYKTKPVIIVAEQETKAIKVAKQLQTQDIKNVSCLRGGLASWRSANLPLVS